MGTLTVVGFGLAILFVAASGVLGNSLRHRNKELDAAVAKSEELEKAWGYEKELHVITKKLLKIEKEQVSIKIDELISSQKANAEISEKLSGAMNELKAVREAQADTQLKPAAPAPTDSAKPKRKYKKRSKPSAPKQS